MEELVRTTPLGAENEKTIAVWLGRGPNMTRVPGRIDQLIMVTHELGSGPADWQISVPNGANSEALLPILMESLRRYCEERNINLTPRAAQRPPAPKVETPMQVTRIPFPKGMTQEQIDEFSSSLKGLNLTPKLQGPPQ